MKLQFLSGIYPVEMKTVLGMMDRKDGFGVIPIVTHNLTLSVNIVSKTLENPEFLHQNNFIFRT